MIFLRVILISLFLSSCGSLKSVLKPKSIKQERGQDYIFDLSTIDFNKKTSIISTYSESSSTWNNSTWNRVESANTSRMILVQCLRNPDRVNLDVFDKLREKFAENFYYWLDKGICQYQKMQYPQSYFSFEFSRQFANEKQKKQIDQWIGGIYFKQGYWNKAIELWTSSKLPNSYQWDTSFARLFNGQMEKGEKYFNTLVKNEQINDSIILALSHIYVARSQYLKAQELLLKVSKKGKRLRKSYFFLQAYLLRKSGNTDGLKKFSRRVPKAYKAEMQEFLTVK